MDNERLEKIESHLAHVENQLDQLNQVVIEQGRMLDRLRKDHARLAATLQRDELDRIKNTNPPPPHYQ